jgi:hypothetical protein
VKRIYWKSNGIFRNLVVEMAKKSNYFFMQVLTRANPVYIGNIIRHKSEQSFFSGKKVSLVPEQEQIVIENNHEPIIDRQMFEDVQRILSQPKGRKCELSSGKQLVSFDKNIFQGKLFCGSCKANMVRVNKYRIINGKKEQYKTFQCSTHRNYNDLCDTRNIAENVLCDILYATIQKHLCFIKGIKKQVQRNVQYSFEEKLKQAESKKQKVINLKNCLEQEYMRTYSDYAEGCVSQAVFLQYKDVYHEKMELYKEQEKKCVKEEKWIKKCQTALQKLVSDWLCFQNAKKLTETMVEICIERIEIFADNRVEVKLKYQDCFNDCEKYILICRKRGATE